MNPIAIFYGNTSIYYSSILIILSLLCAFVLGLSLYLPRHKFGFAYFIFFPLATVSSVLLSRIIHWYCNMEQYENFRAAITQIDSGDYCITGVIIAVWLCSMLLFAIRAVKKPTDLLDASAPSLAFIFCIIRFSHYFSDTCRGEKIVNVYFISACILLAITIGVIVFHLIAKTEGQTFRFFLLLFSAEEVFIDSARNDASHLFFSGDKFAGLNKGASFMGLSQFFSALMLIYLFVYFTIISSHNNKSRKIVSIILFVLGLAIAGGCEYLVQRFTGMWHIIYPGQIIGLLMMVSSICILAFKPTQA